MPLDAYSRRLLAARRAAGIPPVRDQDLAELRAARAAWRARESATPVPVDTIFERTVAGAFPVRVYRPASPGPLPAIVYFHGGGWVLGDLDHSDAFCREVANDVGAVVVNVAYRLAPEHRYPVAAEDAYAALLWTTANAAELSLHPARLAVAGASAGGNLAAAVTLMTRDRGGPRLAAQFLAYPVLDNRCETPSYRAFAPEELLATEDMPWYWQQYLGTTAPCSDPYACPLTAPDLAGLPPALIITAEYDAVRDDGERYAARLRDAGVPLEATRYPGTLHTFLGAPRSYDKAAAAAQQTIAFFRRCFGEFE